ncbi:MAG TPA: glycosyltransferase family 4 protein [Blastocatellia bacterium]|nr:glycosyltransferase family 4 protein [Blastocatellia bacterium]
MKILQICSATEMGGGEVHVADLVRGLADRGHAVYLAVRPDSPLREPLAGVIASWHELALRNSLDVQSARAIAGLINSHGIDIVHAHMGRDYLVAALASRNVRRAKLILTRHHYLPLKRNALYRWMLEDVAAVIAVSDAVRESILERLQLPHERVRTIPNWIDPARFRPIERDAARALFRLRGSLVVACVGQVTHAKGQEEFVRAAGRVSQVRPDIEFLIAGDEGEEGKPFTGHLMKLAGTLGLGDKLKFLGHVRHIPELLAAVDVIVVPSWDEGFSLVTIEAMAARRAVLASNVGGIAGIIKDNTTGLLFPPRDVQALAERLLYLVSDAPLRERLSVQGQRDVYTRFGRDQIIERIESLYLEALGAGGLGPAAIDG